MKTMEASKSLAEEVRGFRISCQRELFAWVEELPGSAQGRYRKLVLALEMVGATRTASHAGACAEASRDACAGVSGQDGLQYQEDHGAGGAVAFGYDVSVSVWLAPGVRFAERVDVFACLQGVCGGGVAGSSARGANRAGILGWWVLFRVIRRP